MSDNNIGKTLRHIRVSKKLTQKEISPRKAPRTIVSKHELGMQQVTVENLDWYLEALQISGAEFQFIRNHYQAAESQLLVDRFMNIFNKRDEASLYKLHKDIQQYNQGNHYDWYLFLIEAYIESIISYLKKELKAEEFDNQLKTIAHQAWEKINSFDDWFLNEIRMLNFISYHMSFDQVESFAKQLIAKLNQYESYPGASQIESSFILNYVLLNMREYRNETAQELLLNYEESIYSTNNIELISLYKMRHAIMQEDNSSLKQILTSVDYLLEENEIIKNKMRQEIYHFAPSFFIENSEMLKEPINQADAFGFYGNYWLIA